MTDTIFTPVGIPTGFDDLDRITDGGLWTSELTILAGRPSVGKTALALGIALNVARFGSPVLYLSLSQATGTLHERLQIIESGWDGYRVRGGMLTTDAEVDHLRKVNDRLNQLPLTINDVNDIGQTFWDIAQAAKLAKGDSRLDLLVIDGLQSIFPADEDRVNPDQVQSYLRRLKTLAMQLHTPTLLLSQLNRVPEGRDSRPRLTDLPDAAIEEFADNVLLLYRPMEGDDDFYDRYGNKRESTADLVVAKQRNGPSGEITLAWKKECMKFTTFDYTTGVIS